MKREQDKASQVLEEPHQEFVLPKEIRTVLDSIEEHVVNHDNQMRILWANKAAGDSVGFSPEELVGRHCYEVWQQRSDPCLGCPVQHALKTGRPQQGETTSPDGRFWFVKGYPVKAEDGKIEGAVEITTDITKRKRGEIELRESEEKYRRLIEQSLQGIFVVQDMRVVFTNTTLTSITGYTAEEFSSLTPEQIRSMVHPDDQQLVWARYQARLAGEDVPHHYEFRALRKDGSVWSAEMHANRIMYGGRPAIQGVVLDISERKVAERSLKASEEKYSSLFQHSHDAIIIHDLEGSIVDVNQRVLDLFGYDMSRILALKISDLHPAEAAETSKAAFTAISQNGFVSFEIDFKKKNGDTFPAEVSASLFDAGGTTLIQGIVRDITERKRAEEALRRSEEQHRALVENINEIIFTLDTRGRFTYLSPVAERTLGYNPTEITGQSFTCFVHPDDAPGLLVNFERTLSSDLKPHEFRALAEDGSTHYMRVSCKPISEQDRLTGLTGIMSDITVNKRADAVLKESEEMYRTLVRTTTDAVSVTDLQGNITEVSGRTVELHGYGKPEDLIGRSIFELIVPEQHRRALANFKKVLKDGFVRSLEYTFVRKDGTQFIGELDAALIKDASDDPKAMIAATRNITERKRAEKALRVSEKRFRDIVENASEWIWEVNAQGVYTYSSPVVKHILGYEPDEILGKHFYDLFCPEKREELKSEAFGIFRTKRPFREFINCNVHKNGQIVWISTNGVPILSETGEAVGYRGTDTDITECKLAQDQLAVEREQMVRTLRSIDDGVIVTDLDGKVVMVNSAAEALTGWTEDDALGRDLAEVFIAGAPQASATTGAADRILEPGRESALAERAILVSRGGERRTVAYSSARIRNKENMPSGLVIIFSDISMPESEDRPPSPA